MRLIPATWRAVKSFWYDTSGIMLPYVTLMLVVIIGLSVLALDGARRMSLEIQMQSAADALALAGARELDLKSGAINRATNAINNLVTNGISGMGVSPPITVQSINFYSALPIASAGFGGTTTTSDSSAKFVGVTVALNPATVPTILPINFVNASNSNSFDAPAQAIAGNAGQQICKVPPVFICNPWETAGNTNDAAATATLISNLQPGSVGVRTQFKVLNDGQTGPGHFGWLVPPDGCTGASCLQTWISENSAPECFSAGTVDLNTGAKNGALPGFNMRFDIGADLNHAPDVNVRKGYVPPNNGNWCNASPDPNAWPVGTSTRATGMPEDTAFTNFSNGGSSGNGQWDCQTYWTFNHQSAPLPTVRADGGSGVCGTPATTTLSRYDVYQYEITNSLVADWSRGDPSNPANNYAAPPPYNSAGENGAPLCTGVGNAIKGRRVLAVAVINCEAQSGLITGGSTANNIPSAGFASFFMNEPVPTTGPAANRNLVGEMVGFVGLGGGGTGAQATVFNDVQLYR